MANLTLLNKKRGNIKHKLTSFKTYLDNFIEIKDYSDLKLAELRLKVLNFNNILTDFENIQSEIELLVEETDLDDQYNYRLEFESVYYSALAQADILLNSTNAKTDVSVHSASSSIHENSCHLPSRSTQVKLPVIQLPKFNGDLNVWLEFRDTFQSLIHHNDSITDMQKYHYLRSCLTGSVYECIRNLEFSASGYENAWNLICKRFNNSRSLIRFHVKAILSIPSLTKEVSKDIRNFIDTISNHIAALKGLKQPVENWNTIFIISLSEKLDKVTAKEWESEIISDSDETTDDHQIVDKFIEFLRTKANLLEQLEGRRDNVFETKSNKFPKSKHSLFSSINYSCYNCNGAHAIWNCEDFLQLSADLRNKRVQELKLCISCLRSNHVKNKCPGYSCRFCKAKHNSLLHIGTRKSDVSNDKNNYARKIQSSEGSPTVSSHISSKNLSSNSLTLLSTAIIKIFASDGSIHNCRALLDSGSESNFITESLVQRLGLEKKNANISLVGINLVSSPIKYKCATIIASNNSIFSAKLELLILPQITSKLPRFSFDGSTLNIPENLNLADPYFCESEGIDLLIGSDIFWKLIQGGNISLGKGKPTLQNSKLGWIISGEVPLRTNTISCNYVQLHDLNLNLKQFWEIEENSFVPNISKTEHSVSDMNNFFKDTVSRDISGRFIVKIPFNDLVDNLGESKTTAINRLLSIERRFLRDDNFKILYKEFMTEYLSLGHMSNVPNLSDTQRHFLPHHGVLRDDKSSTRLRVVFDGSAKTSSQISLNEAQIVGPTIQSDLFSIILRFRQHQYVMAADIKQMYRQVLIHPSQRRFQSIMWRNEPSDDIEIFELNTVTYGTSSAPYLAIRCLHELASETKTTYPLASTVIEKDFYVDDLLTGDDDPDRLVETCKNVISILQTACFELRKFVSNDVTLTNLVANSVNNDDTLNIGCHDETKTLGISWSVQEDSLFYKAVPSLNEIITKRTILSSISKIFDPLGLLSPIIIKTKIILQQIWSAGIDWDDQLPSNIIKEWDNIKSQISIISTMSFPRCVITKNAQIVELHGFCDASNVAYGACIFVKSIDETGQIFVHLLCAKSKVAPIKTITIPRLELCGALTLTHLMNKVRDSLTIAHKVFFWCDSQVVLHWIKQIKNCNSLNVFVRNRVKKIQSLSEINKWSYVSTRDNPADIISRGATPLQLKHFNMWWNGPQFLHNSVTELKHPTILSILETPELRKNVSCLVAIQTFSFPFERFSDFNKLIHVVALILRFKHNCLNIDSKILGPITTKETLLSLNILIRIAQHEYFSKDIEALKVKQCLHNKSVLLNLTPFLDDSGILRVGGRLNISNYHFDKRHPIILPKNHILSELILRNEHIRLLHAGPLQTLFSSRDRFWILSGKTLAKKIIRNCLICFKDKAKPFTTLMGNLPKARITESYPFAYTGIDYAGPFLINDKRGRGSKKIKCYICLYVCLSSKCIHLEVVGDLSTDNFIASLRRFTSRRGLPIHIYSDNGRNFIGAQSKLQELGLFLESNKNKIIDNCINFNLQWHFIPPYSPHFGGLWESNIKSMKAHLYKVLNTNSLVYEEFQTVVIQIEAVLNSRPLGPLSTDPNDPRALTPSHLLIGRSLVSLPDPYVLDIKENQLSRFQYIQSMVQHFWNRWKKDYLNQLQVRSKWKIQKEELKPGMLVIVKDIHLPPRQWRLGRIESVHTGSDNITRVVTLKTQCGVIKRAVSQICLLPFSETV